MANAPGSRSRLRSPRRSPTPATIAVIVFLVLALLRILIFQPESSGSRISGEFVTVRRVIDGDTFELTDNQRVRMLGIDAPEAGFDGTTAEPYSGESSQWLRNRIEGRSIQLRIESRRKDRYGRLLAWVFEQDGTLVNQRMLTEGQARLLPDFGLPPDLEPTLRAAESEARVAKRGLWEVSRGRRQ